MTPLAEAPRAIAPLPPWQLFVGRARELRELAGVADELLRGRGRLALITGEPGIGKTRLAEEIARRGAAAGARVIWGQCWEAGGAPAYWPWSQALRRLAEAAGDDAWRAWRAGLGDALAPLALDAPLPDAPRADAESARFAAFDAVSRLLHRAAASRPLLVVLEDLHAADLPSLLLLELVVGEMTDAPLVVLATYRPDDAERRGAIAAAARAPGPRRPPRAPRRAGGRRRRRPARRQRRRRGLAGADRRRTRRHRRQPALRRRDRARPAGRPRRVAARRTTPPRRHPRSPAPPPRPAVARRARPARAGGGVRRPTRPRRPAAGQRRALAAIRDALREGIAAGVLADAAHPHGVAFRHALLRDVLYDDLPPAPPRPARRRGRRAGAPARRGSRPTPARPRPPLSRGRERRRHGRARARLQRAGGAPSGGAVRRRGGRHRLSPGARAARPPRARRPGAPRPAAGRARRGAHPRRRARRGARRVARRRRRRARAATAPCSAAPR
ncbi:MAG: ATP-binding protein [Candidatus Binatia bacterium]